MKTFILERILTEMIALKVFTGIEIESFNDVWVVTARDVTVAGMPVGFVRCTQLPTRSDPGVHR